MGTGPIKGFAQTLALGIFLSMFTALVVTRFIMRIFYSMGFEDVKFYGQAKERKTIDFLSKRMIFIAASCAVIIAGIIVMAVNSQSEKHALNYSLEFQGGTSTTVDFGQDFSIEEIESKVIPVVSNITGDNNIQTQKVNNGNAVIIKTRTLSLEERQALDEALYENFGVDDEDISSEHISSMISGEMRRTSIIAVIVAVVLMLIYIWIRFRDVRFGAASVIALLHDAMVIVACYALTRISVGGTFIAAILTIIGYSINDTIVTFDRIRENQHLATGKKEMAELVNTSVSQTVTRSLFTSITTFFTVLALYVFGQVTCVLVV
jgi:SecD/SecF fusion protein